MKIKYYLYIAWFQSLLAMLGSLYFSEILKYPPCVLCWYQRIATYPLVFIIPIAILFKDTKIYRYIFTLAIPGLLISIYHNLLYYKIIPDGLSPCSTGVSCTTKYIEYFGFLTIPLLGLIAFAVIIVSTYIYYRNERRH